MIVTPTAKPRRQHFGRRLLISGHKPNHVGLARFDRSH
jgi:hypothetical protein